MWKLKVLLQFVLAHVPGGEGLNFMLQEARGSRSPEKLRQRIRELVGELAFLQRQIDLEGKTVVEVGTGWDAINTLLLALFGAQAIYSYDHVRHVRFSSLRNVLTVLDAMTAEIAEAAGLPESPLRLRLASFLDAPDLAALLEAACITYIAPGDACATGLPDHSIDLFYSYAVLEHVPEEIVHGLCAEAQRVLKSNGRIFHYIGEHDHYISVSPSLSKVNFLKYPEWLWRILVKNKISYHNRLREKEFLAIFAAHGTQVEVIDSFVDERDLIALKTMKIDRRFSGMSDRELAVHATRVLLSF
jgi:SAM-dependent methyltransferase